MCIRGVLELALHSHWSWECLRITVYHSLSPRVSVYIHIYYYTYMYMCSACLYRYIDVPTVVFFLTPASTILSNSSRSLPLSLSLSSAHSFIRPLLPCSKLRRLKCFKQFDRVRGWLDTNFKDHSGFTVSLPLHAHLLHPFLFLMTIYMINNYILSCSL